MSDAGIVSPLASSSFTIVTFLKCPVQRCQMHLPSTLQNCVTLRNCHSVPIKPQPLAQPQPPLMHLLSLARDYSRSLLEVESCSICPTSLSRKPLRLAHTAAG